MTPIISRRGDVRLVRERRAALTTMLLDDLSLIIAPAFVHVGSSYSISSREDVDHHALAVASSFFPAPEGPRDSPRVCAIDYAIAIAGLPAPDAVFICLMIASPNSEHFNFVAPSIMR